MGILVARIREKIAQQRLSVHSLEKEAKLKPSAVHNILSGRSRNPSIIILQAIAKTLNCTVSDLIGEESPSQQSPERHSFKAPDHFKNNELYVDCLFHLSAALKKRKLWLKKEQIIDWADEIYIYSLKKEENYADQYFTEWLIEKSISPN